MSRQDTGPLGPPDVDAPTRSSNVEQIRRLVAAARRCFERDGVGRTRMKNVAEEAGIVRQTAYEFVSGLPELVELALLARAQELADIAGDRLGPGSGDVSEDLIEHIAVLTEACRDDPEFLATAEALSRGPAMRFLAASARVHKIYLAALRPRFDRCRDAGVLRSDVEDGALTAWIQNCTTPLATRTDLSADDLREVLRTFLLPALLSPSPG